jgi:hypothetical protein
MEVLSDGDADRDCDCRLLREAQAQISTAWIDGDTDTLVQWLGALDRSIQANDPLQNGAAFLIEYTVAGLEILLFDPTVHAFYCTALLPQFWPQRPTEATERVHSGGSVDDDRQRRADVLRFRIFGPWEGMPGDIDKYAGVSYTTQATKGSFL